MAHTSSTIMANRTPTTRDHPIDKKNQNFKIKMILKINKSSCLGRLIVKKVQMDHEIDNNAICCQHMLIHQWV